MKNSAVHQKKQKILLKIPDSVKEEEEDEKWRE